MTARPCLSDLARQPLSSTVGPADEDQRRVIREIRRKEFVGRSQPGKILARIDRAHVEDVPIRQAEPLSHPGNLVRRPGAEARVGAERDVSDALGRDMVQVDDLPGNRFG